MAKKKRGAEDDGQGSASKRAKSEDKVKCYGRVWEGKKGQRTWRRCQRNGKLKDGKYRCPSRHQEWLDDDEIEELNVSGTASGTASPPTPGPEEEIPSGSVLGETEDTLLEVPPRRSGGVRPRSLTGSPRDARTHASPGRTGGMRSQSLPASRVGGMVQVEELDDPCAYLRQRLGSLNLLIEHYRKEPANPEHALSDLIVMVLLGINNVQDLTTGAGFSIHTEKNGITKLEYPGRPLVMMSDYANNHVLNVVQFSDDGNVTLNFLSPVAWKFGLNDRNEIFEQSWRTLKALGWQIGLSDADRPDNGFWIDSPATYDEEMSGIYIVLNAWALALGLSPNIDFQPRRDFVKESRDIFHLTLKGVHVDWKLVRAFLRCHGFVSDIEIDVPPDRRFSHTERHVNLLQYLNGSQFSGSRILINQKQDHREASKFDDWSEEDRRITVPWLVENDEWDPRMSADEAKSLFLELPPPSRDYCYYFREVVARLNQQQGYTDWLAIFLQMKTEAEVAQLERSELTRDEIYFAIAAVDYAIAQGRGDSRDVSVMDMETLDVCLHGMQSRERTEKVLYGPRPLILPWEVDSHRFLVVIQAAAPQASNQYQSATPSLTVHVLDWATWKLEKTQRQRVYSAIRHFIRSTFEGESRILGKIRWVTAQQQPEDERFDLHLVITAWMILLGLPSHSKPYESTDKFFEDAQSLVCLVLGGFADWQLIVAFLKCHGVVPAHGDPPENCRFSKTVVVDSSTLQPMFEEMQEAKRDYLDNTGEDIGIPMENYPMDNGRAHDRDWPSDQWTQDDRSRCIPALQDAGQFSPGLTSEALRQRYQKLTGGLPPGFDACAYAKKQLADLETTAIRSCYEKLGVVPRKSGQSMSFGEIFLNIAAITTSINDHQPGSEIFDMISKMDVTLSVGGEVPCRRIRTSIFSLHPLLIPFALEGHHILLVIQLDDDNQPSISIIDHRHWALTLIDRRKVFNAVVRLLRHSRWCTEDTGNLRLPEHAQWIRSANQVEEINCGYYTILSAWALAMGLELNLEFVPAKPELFYAEVENLLILARGGALDWKLLYAFLLCNKFVSPDRTVPKERQFAPSSRTLKSEIDLEDYIVKVRAQSDGRIMHRLDRDLRNPMSVNLYASLRHDTQIQSDGWTNNTRRVVIPFLVARGLFDPQSGNEQLTACYQIAVLVNKHQDFSWTSNQAIEKCNELLDSLNESLPGHRNSTNDIEKDPCTFWEARCKNFVQLNNAFQTTHFRSVHRMTTKKGDYLSDDDVFLSIASVVLAINNIGDSPDEIPKGGLAFADSNGVHVARSPNEIAGYRMIGHRRCWVLPFVIDRELALEVEQYKRRRSIRIYYNQDGQIRIRAGHTILALVQETQQGLGSMSGGSEFQVCFFDSMPGHLSSARHYLYYKVQRAAKGLGWSTARNSDENIKFSNVFWYANVPQQVAGWECGFHTILNAWILAMGLTPVPLTLDETTPIYDELRSLTQLALSGLLDWRTLVAWLFCRRLVKQRHLGDVPQNRQFECTSTQTSVVELSHDILKQYEDRHSIMEGLPDDVVPFDRSHDVDFAELVNNSTPIVWDQRHLEPGPNDHREKYVIGRNYDDDELSFLDSYDHASVLESVADIMDYRPNYYAFNSRTADPLSWLDDIVVQS